MSLELDERGASTYAHVCRGAYKRIGDGVNEFTRNTEIAYLDFSSRVAKNVGGFNIYRKDADHVVHW